MKDEECKIPDTGNCYEFKYDVQGKTERFFCFTNKIAKKWVKWVDLAVNPASSKIVVSAATFSQIIVPTVDTVTIINLAPNFLLK